MTSVVAATNLVSYKFVQMKKHIPAEAIGEGGEYECAICYKKINKTCFMCTDPCNKVFHPACLEESFIQAEENNDEDDEVQHRCCYCRRHLNLSNYGLELFAQNLRRLGNSKGFDVDGALELIKKNIANNVDQDEDEDNYEIYYTKNQTGEARKPKQSNQDAYKNKNKRTATARHAIRKSYGMRR